MKRRGRSKSGFAGSGRRSVPSLVSARRTQTTSGSEQPRAGREKGGYREGDRETCVGTALTAATFGAAAPALIQPAKAGEAGPVSNQASSSRSAAASPEVIEIAKSPDFLWNSAIMTREGRLLLMPGWLGPTPGVVEVLPDGSFKPFPGNEWNEWAEGKQPTKHFVDVNSIIPDGKGNLWVLDAAAPHFGAAIEGAVKVVQVSIATSRRSGSSSSTRRRPIPARGLRTCASTATMPSWRSSKEGSFYVIDLRDNSYRRILVGHPLMRGEPDDVPTIEGRKIILQNGKPLHINNDLLDFRSDPGVLHFMCLFGRKIFKAHVNTLKDPSLTDGEIANRVAVAIDVGGPWVSGICRDRDGPGT